MTEQNMNMVGRFAVMRAPNKVKTLYVVADVFKLTRTGAEKVRLQHPKSKNEHVQYAKSVRLATQKEIEHGQRIDPKDVFEKWVEQQDCYVTLRFSLRDRLFHFDPATNQYLYVSVNLAWLLWRELKGGEYEF